MRGASPKAPLRSREQLAVRLDHLGDCDPVSFLEAYRNDAGRGAAHGADVGFETDAPPLFRDEDDFVVAACEPDPAEFVAFVERQRDQAAGADRRKLSDCDALGDAG